MSCACRTAVGANRNAYMIENAGNTHINGRCKRSIFRDKLTSLSSEHILERSSTVSADCTLMTECKQPPNLHGKSHLKLKDRSWRPHDKYFAEILSEEAPRPGCAPIWSSWRAIQPPTWATSCACVHDSQGRVIY